MREETGAPNPQILGTGCARPRFVAFAPDMEIISIHDLVAQGYTEDPVARHRFELKWCVPSAPPLICFVLTIGLALFGKFPLRFAVPCAVGALIVLVIVLQVAEHRPVMSRHSGKPMLKFQNASPPRGVIRDTIYVCRDSKTFFRRAWLVESNPA